MVRLSLTPRRSPWQVFVRQKVPEGLLKAGLEMPGGMDKSAPAVAADPYLDTPEADNEGGGEGGGDGAEANKEGGEGAGRPPIPAGEVKSALQLITTIWLLFPETVN
jgi:hypothetical protein